MTETPIEWTRSDDGQAGKSWNPVVGCSIESPGCAECYAMRMAARIEAMDKTSHHAPHYRGLTKKVKGKAVWTGVVRAAPESVLLAPLSWRKPARCFVNSMSDPFHPDLPDEVIDRVFAVKARTPHITYIVVTKRAARAHAYLNDPATYGRIMEAMAAIVAEVKPPPVPPIRWPLPNVWLLVSAERQKEANERIPFLLRTPAAKRGVSLEPMLGEIDLCEIYDRPNKTMIDALDGHYASNVVAVLDRLVGINSVCRDGPALDWVITGGMNGDTPALPEWFTKIRDQCQDAGVPYFHKQNGTWRPVFMKNGVWHTADDLKPVQGKPAMQQVRSTMFIRATKAEAGAKLDGREWREFPR